MLNKIKLFVMDVDGTLTDGKIYIGSSGELFKTFNVKDGYAIGTLLKQKGVKTAIITGRESPITKNRAQELEIDYLYQNVSNKFLLLQQLTTELAIGLSEVAYAGDDLPDLECMKKCGYSICPSDAVNEIKKTAKYISRAKGGEGVIREYVNYLIDQSSNYLE